MIWIALGIVAVVLGVAVVFNIAGLSNSQALYFRKVNDVSRGVFSRIPPWSLLIARGEPNQASQNLLAQINARITGLILIVAGVAVIITELKY